MLSLVAEAISTVIIIMFQVLKATWWIVIPVVIFLRVKPLWLISKNIEYAKTLEWILLEIILPPEVEKTPKAMENVLAGIHGAWSPTKGRAKWLQGKFVDRFSFEMAGIDGELHFYVRCQTAQRDFVESKIFSQYPDAEIYEVEDYTKILPSELPNKDYDLWGADYVLAEDWAYPILTHIDFEDKEEERRLDPLSQFAELVSKMDKGEYVWMQFVAAPVVSEIAGKAQVVIDNEVGRKKSKPAGVGTEVASFVQNMQEYYMSRELTPRSGGEPGTEVNMQKLTPGEHKKIERMEIKASKVSFSITIRVLYIARKDVYHKAHIPAIQGFFNQFASGINSFKPEATPSNSIIFFKKQRNFFRKSNLAAAYTGRFLGVLSKPYILNIEELATLYHYPGRVVRAPLMPRISSRTAEPPKGLPY